MTEGVKRRLIRFCNQHDLWRKRLIVAFSGGVDSTALLLSLLSLSPPLDLLPLHIDHGWDPRSHEIAQSLKKWFEKRWNRPLLIRQIPQETSLSNREEKARRARYALFHQVAQEVGAAGVLLGHQAEDQGETILKRLLEGGSLPRCGGMREAREERGLFFWRPFLGEERRTLRALLQEAEIQPWEDPANQESCYQRVQLRHLLPEIERRLGRKVLSPLLHLGQEARELADSLDLLTEPLFADLFSNKCGLWWPLRAAGHSNLYLLSALLRRIAQAYGLSLSREEVVGMSTLLQKKCGGQSLFHPPASWVVDRGSLFLLREPLPSCGHPLPLLSAGSFRWGGWLVEVNERRTEKVEKENGWRDLWEEGRLISYAALPVSLVPPDLTLPLVGRTKRVGRAYTDAKVPTFLRQCVPFLANRNQVVGDFLMGNSLSMKGKRKTTLKITIRPV